MQVNTINYNNTSFNGLFTKSLPKKNYSLTRMANILEMSRRDVYKQTQDMNSRQMDFLDSMTQRYNSMYFQSENKENPQVLFNILKTLTEPERVHSEIIAKINGSFASIGELIKLISNSKNKEFVDKTIQYSRRDNEINADFLIDILQSPHKNDYIEQQWAYRAYFRLNKDDKDAVNKLDKLIDENKYDRYYYEKLEDLKRIDYTSVNAVISKENLDKYYTKDGTEFIRCFADRLLTPSALSDKAKQSILDIYRTTNKNNINIRKDLYNRYAENFYYCNGIDDEIFAMNSIFNKIDKDDYCYKFVEKCLEESLDCGSIAALDNILNIVSPLKAYIFRKNIYHIIGNTVPGAERDRALSEEILNPFYKNKTRIIHDKVRDDAIKSGYVKGESKFSKLIKYFENLYNKYKYNKLVEKDVIKETKPIKNQAEPAAAGNKGAVVENIIQVPVEKTETEIIKPEAQIIKNIPSAEQEGLKFKPYSKMHIRKIAVQKSVREFINKRLHPSVVKEHERIYTEKATKMRIKLLPEILASIKETRADKRAMGIKHPKVSNFDAVDLYTRIDGKNRKLINYMLKIRDSEGKRIFDVLDIIEVLRGVHGQVILGKLKPAEAKALHEQFYQEQLNTYGKVKKINNFKNKNINKK